ncbi:hypothetical protein JK207_00550 [Gluconobacter cerinus]|uniref:hypothetical protein n=1 Tax=Gluconobacter cerinus TaxID=38307 RepID=UPI001B8B54BE|nr:hypothetical protein [Gluconobacter cerinus]MBS1020525.1 hypothetical protein [Gluconobacter cerinus]
MKRLVLSLALLASPAIAFGQSVPAGVCSYTQTGNPSCILQSTDVAGWQKAKTDVDGGTSHNQNLDAPSVSGGKIDQSDVTAKSLQTPAGSFNQPQAGGQLGAGSVTFPSPDQKVQGSLEVGMSNAPIIRLHSLIAPNLFTIWLGGDGNGNLALNSDFASFNMFAHTINFGGTKFGAVANFYGSGNYGPYAIWQAETGEGWMVSPNANLHISAGNAWIILHSLVQVSSQSFITDTSKCGSLAGAAGCLVFRAPDGTQTYAPSFQ